MRNSLWRLPVNGQNTNFVLNQIQKTLRQDCVLLPREKEEYTLILFHCFHLIPFKIKRMA